MMVDGLAGLGGPLLLSPGGWLGCGLRRWVAQFCYLTDISESSQ